MAKANLVHDNLDMLILKDFRREPVHQLGIGQRTPMQSVQ